MPILGLIIFQAVTVVYLKANRKILKPYVILIKMTIRLSDI